MLTIRKSLHDANMVYLYFMNSYNNFSSQKYFISAKVSDSYHHHRQ